MTSVPRKYHKENKNSKPPKSFNQMVSVVAGHRKFKCNCHDIVYKLYPFKF